jgi:hypothetical protein
MSIVIALHDPTKAWVTAYKMDGRDCACLHISDSDGRSIDIYTSPAIAYATADALNVAYRNRQIAAEARAAE